MELLPVMKKQFCIGALSLVAVLAQANTYPSIHQDKIIEANGFECADSAVDVLDILGRGPNFPNFLINDVETELSRQNKSSQLVSIRCTGEPELKAGSVALENDESKTILSKLSVTFPLELEVMHNSNVKNMMHLVVDHNYLVENLDKDNQTKVTQNFIVKSTNK
jgi:hypothetical protein